MGLNPTPVSTSGSPQVSRPAMGVLDPRTGQPVGADDRYFLEINHELSDKGFFVAAAGRAPVR